MYLVWDLVEVREPLLWYFALCLSRYVKGKMAGKLNATMFISSHLSWLSMDAILTEWDILYNRKCAEFQNIRPRRVWATITPAELSDAISRWITWRDIVLIKKQSTCTLENMPYFIAWLTWHEHYLNVAVPSFKEIREGAELLVTGVVVSLPLNAFCRKCQARRKSSL